MLPKFLRLIPSIFDQTTWKKLTHEERSQRMVNFNPALKKEDYILLGFSTDYETLTSQLQDLKCVIHRLYPPTKRIRDDINGVLKQIYSKFWGGAMPPVITRMVIAETNTPVDYRNKEGDIKLTIPVNYNLIVRHSVKLVQEYIKQTVDLDPHEEQMRLIQSLKQTTSPSL
jgi:hypothetical protein